MIEVGIVSTEELRPGDDSADSLRFERPPYQAPLRYPVYALSCSRDGTVRFAKSRVSVNDAENLAGRALEVEERDRELDHLVIGLKPSGLNVEKSGAANRPRSIDSCSAMGAKERGFG